MPLDDQLTKQIGTVLQSTLNGPHCPCPDPPGTITMQDCYLAKSASHRSPTDMKDKLHSGGELTVQRGPVEAAEGGKRLESGRHLRRTVRVHGPGTAVMAGVQCGE